MQINFDRVPLSLAEHNSWVLWKLVDRDGKPNKEPFQVSGAYAKSNDPTTWATFAEARKAVADYSGIGFVFSEADPFCGIDLDGCRNPETGIVAEWARQVILALDSYAEVSPSETGIKVFCIGKCPFASGKKIAVNAPVVCDKAPAIEVYDKLRYFAVTGMRVTGPLEPQERQVAIDWIKNKFWPDEPKATPTVDFRSNDAVVERARKYLSRLPPAVSGSGGHNATFHAACVLCLGFSLSEQDATGLMHEYNQRCQPVWSEKDIVRKVREANKQPGERGYLRNAAPENWTKIAVPKYAAPAQVPEPKSTTIAQAARDYLDTIREGRTPIIETGLPDLDYALGGGVEKGEMVIFGARPSHGKSAAALQCVHWWTAHKMRTVIVSEEMSPIALGKRTLQFVSKLPQEHWQDRLDILEHDIADYDAEHATCTILDGCGTVDAACRGIENAVKEDGAQCAVVDYAQLLRAPGRTRYEQVTNISIMLRQVATSQKIVLLVLCQLNRGIEGRSSFIPIMSDLKDAGQLEQDADVVVFLVWPWRQNTNEPMNKYQFYVCKNRNRAINQNVVVCRFLPDRQALVDSLPENPHERQGSAMYRGEGDLPR